MYNYLKLKVPMSNSDNNYIFLPEWFPTKFSESEKKLTWLWESGHNPVPVSYTHLTLPTKA